MSSTWTNLSALHLVRSPQSGRIAFTVFNYEAIFLANRAVIDGLPRNPGDPIASSDRTVDRGRTTIETQLSASELEGLIERIVDRDAEAFAGLYDRTAPYVFGLLLRMLGQREAAEEVAQEVYMTVWRNAAAYDATRGTPATWIGLISRSRAVDRLRSERSYAGAVVRATKAATSAVKEVHVMPDAPPSPAEALEISERRRRVRAALKELPSEQRRLVELAFFGGLSHSEIARATETPLGTVKSRIRAGIGKLEKILTPTHDQRAGPAGTGLE